jgi:putative tricarboxylic transport membrane protein
MWQELLSVSVLVPWLLGMAFGIVVGSTPGLTATMAVALLLPVTFHLPPTAGLALVLGVSFTAIFAGDIPATLLRIPGTPASAAATLDAYSLAQQGQAGPVLLTNLLCSAVGGTVGVFLLMIVAPALAQLALRFSSYEYFWLAVLGLSLSAVVSSEHSFKSLASAALGVLLGTVGWDEVGAVERYTWGYGELYGGLGFIPAMIGLFGLAEVFRSTSAPQLWEYQVRIRIGTVTREVFSRIGRNAGLVAVSSAVGTLIGALPGAGADIAAWVAYALAKRTSRAGDQFGKGSWQGVIAPTSANNAAVAGAWIPALVFGIPGDAVTAIVLGALLMYNIRPGPNLFHENIHQLHVLLGVAFLTQILLIPAGLIGIASFSAVMRLPRSFLLAAVVIFSVLGAYAIELKWMHVWVMFAFAVLGIWMSRHRIPTPPLILGMILQPVLEFNLRQGLIKSQGSWGPFFWRVDCLVLISLLVVLTVGPRCVNAFLNLRTSPRTGARGNAGP